VSGGKFRALVDTAALMLRAAGEPSRVAFFKQILTRAHVPSDQSAEVLAIATAGTVSLNEAVPKTAPARHDILKRPLTWLCVLLALSLLMAIVWRINTLRNSYTIAEISRHVSSALLGSSQTRSPCVGLYGPERVAVSASVGLSTFVNPSAAKVLQPQYS